MSARVVGLRGFRERVDSKRMLVRCGRMCKNMQEHARCKKGMDAGARGERFESSMEQGTRSIAMGDRRGPGRGGGISQLCTRSVHMYRYVEG